MKYLHRPFKAKKGQSVLVHFDQPTRVLLLTDREYKNYKNCKTFRYRGGELEDSPATFDIPETGKWHIIVELGSYYHPKSITASVEILSSQPL